MERTPRSRSLQPFGGWQTPASPSSTDVTVAISPSRAIGKALRVAHAAGWIADALSARGTPLARLLLIYLTSECFDEGAMPRFDLTAYGESIGLASDQMRAGLDELSEAGLIYFSVYGLVVFPEDRNEAECENLLLAADREMCGAFFEERLPAGPTKADLKRRALAAYVLTCVYCERVGTPERDPDGRAWELDRILPGSKGGAYVAENVVLACRACNRDKGARIGWDIDTISLADLEDAVLARVGA